MPRALLLLPVVSVALAAAAYAEPPAPVDEATFVQRAVAADPQIQLAGADELAARAEIAERAVRPAPSLEAEREHVLGDGGEVEHVVALEVPLDVSGRRGRRIAAARARAAAAGASREVAEVASALDAMLAYREASYRRARAAALAEGRAALAAAVDIVGARVRAGDAAPSEIERVELELIEYDDELAAAELERDAAEQALGTRIAAGAVETTGLVPLPAEPPAADVLRDRAAGRPERAALDHLARAAAAEHAAAARAWIPELALRGGAKSLSGGGDTRWGYVVGLAIELPLTGRAAADRARAAADRARVTASGTGLAERTAARIAAARDQLVRRRALAERSAAARGARVASLTQAAAAAYREGGTLGDFLDAYRVAQRARLSALAQHHAARLAEVGLWRAVGRIP